MHLGTGPSPGHITGSPGVNSSAPALLFQLDVVDKAWDFHVSLACCFWLGPGAGAEDRDFQGGAAGATCPLLEEPGLHRDVGLSWATGSQGRQGWG